MHRLFLVGAIALLVSFGGGISAWAQQGTPVLGEVPDPSLCQVQPRAPEAIQQLVGTPMAGKAATPIAQEGNASPTPFVQPEGQEADQQTVDQVAATVRELVACLNAGDYLRAWALYTDDYILRNFAARGPLGVDAVEDLAATPVPVVQEQQIAFVGVINARMLADGRVGAIVETNDPSEGGWVRWYGEFVMMGDRYLIDVETVIEVFQAEGTEGVSTPVAETTTQVTVVSYDIYFEPEEVTIPANTDVTVILPNDGAALHNFSIDALGINVDIPPGEMQQTTINAAPGEYEYYCAVPGHAAAGMVGVLIVQ
ncbi:MAG: cupredoxin domain-containing protein [Chloroflexota bacterium]|nr:cupredoxin domain-containing protein [Chloroflexota bacterium]